jgi:DNA repair protein RadD
LSAKTILRPYQLDAVTAIRCIAAYGEKGAILQLPTGSGKTACFCDVLKGAYKKGKHAIMVVRGKDLVRQASDRLTREGVPHGILQADNSKDTHQRILVCSVDTLYARRMAPKADLVVIDECHLSHSDGYRWLFEQYQEAFKLGVSATPHHRKGMRHIGNRLVRTASINELITRGFLVGGRYFVPYIPNLRGIKKSGGDFNGKELSARTSADAELTASASKIWSAHLRGKSTIVYGVSVEHCRILADGLRGAGARCELITANTKDGVRRDYIRRLENGELDCLVSVGVLTTGIDIPSLRAVLCCRPTESYNLWIQILGRGTRPFPGKEHFLCFDLSGNLYRHGPIESEIICDLDELGTAERLKLKTCMGCYATFETGPEACPCCGASTAEVRERETGKRIHGLTENDDVREVAVEPWEAELGELIARAKEKQMRKGWVYHTLKAKYGDQAADAAWPRIRAQKKWPVKARATMPAS